VLSVYSNWRTAIRPGCSIEGHIPSLLSHIAAADEVRRDNLLTLLRWEKRATQISE
jgi:hypothetical protein